MKDQLTKKRSIKQVRRFSLQVNKKTVRDIEKGIYTVLEASRDLQVKAQTIYN